MSTFIYGVIAGVVAFLLFRRKPNIDGDKELAENQALVDQAIKDLEEGIKKIKPEQRDPKDVTDYYNKGDKK